MDLCFNFKLFKSHIHPKVGKHEKTGIFLKKILFFFIFKIGRVLILGSTGRNFAAGMSGGIAYVLNSDDKFKDR